MVFGSRGKWRFPAMAIVEFAAVHSARRIQRNPGGTAAMLPGYRR
jgi:hypothetical protein